MFCQNCGNKLDNDAYMCVNCGTIIRRSDNIKIVRQRNNKVLGIVSLMFGIFALILSIMLFFNDISSVGMYTKIYERLLYCLEYSLSTILMTIVTLIFSLVSEKNIYSSVAMLLVILSSFFIVTELVVVGIY